VPEDDYSRPKQTADAKTYETSEIRNPCATNTIYTITESVFKFLGIE